MVHYPVQEMRGIPTVENSGNSNDYLMEGYNNSQACNAGPNIGAYSDEVVSYVQGTVATGNLSHPGVMGLVKYNTASAFIAFNAEL